MKYRRVLEQKQEIEVKCKKTLDDRLKYLTAALYWQINWIKLW
jgi:hypothetical protein